MRQLRHRAIYLSIAGVACKFSNDERCARHLKYRFMQSRSLGVRVLTSTTTLCASARCNRAFAVCSVARVPNQEVSVISIARTLYAKLLQYTVIIVQLCCARGAYTRVLR